jgi:hypothetical protein
MAVLEQSDLLENLTPPPHGSRQTFEDRAREIGLAVSRGRQLDFAGRPYVRKRRGLRALIGRIAARR